jgi:hypothetical protein
VEFPDCCLVSSLELATLVDGTRYASLITEAELDALFADDITPKEVNLDDVLTQIIITKSPSVSTSLIHSAFALLFRQKLQRFELVKVCVIIAVVMVSYCDYPGLQSLHRCHMLIDPAEEKQCERIYRSTIDILRLVCLFGCRI